jgi:methionine-rich copper-binding protein CopC
MIRAAPWLALAMLLTTPPAFAHAFLEHAEPPVGSEVTTAPHQVTLRFSEAIEPAFSSIVLHDPQGVVVPIGKPHTTPGDGRNLVVELPDLHAGRYTVTWHATSVDTHKTEGSFQFNVIH